MQEANNPKNRAPRGTIAMQVTGPAHTREDHHNHEQGNRLCAKQFLCL